ncbi:hypothetical protein B0H17DRAFT_1123602 [Mycena rosella]|uniref:Uncharacterized protein n=1 Tax=Mycena rosella TaxID=1033263 RepID=A0AAD7H1Z4_MYCRO|nr:hypothetical protein B0H17DRAFT_1123602 [Mycena rosella]
MASSLFGLCRSFPQFLALRANNSTNQGTAYPIFGGIYPLGATVGPLIGGFFSNVAMKYPKYFGYSFLESYPYFLFWSEGTRFYFLTVEKVEQTQMIGSIQDQFPI